MKLSARTMLVIGELKEKSRDKKEKLSKHKRVRNSHNKKQTVVVVVLSAPKSLWASNTKLKNPNFIINATTAKGGCGSKVGKVLCYKSEGRWLGSRWCHWNFSFK